MKKFISALSSFVIAATAMGGAMVYAQTNDSVPATAKTIIDIQSNKSNTVNVESGKSAEIPVDVYVPQSNGIYSITLRLQVNDGEPGKGSYEDKTGKVYSASDSDLDADHQKALEATYGNYGFKIKGDVTENATNWKNQKICFDSGYFTTNKKHAGYYNVGTMSNFIPDTWTISYIGKKAVDNKSNMDSYAAFAATNDVDTFKKEDYANYKPVTKWTKDESWAYDAALISFTVEVPAGLADGDYVINVVKEPTYNPGPSALFDDNNNLKDKDKWTFIQSSIVGTDSGEDSVERTYESIPLTIKVGEGSSETKAPAEETKAPAEETKAPAEETKAPAQQTEAPGEVVGDKDIVYDLVKKGDKATVAENMTGDNACTVDKGETFSVEWRVKHDQGTAGL
ncbi:MAG: hypothetical protein IKQ91_09240, partial [Oscillospiraceae bacterium]|nr:hypothetical protein [Oscillospiraceae bacterium]